MSEGLTAEAIDRIAELAKQGQKPTVELIPIPGDPRGRVYVVDEVKGTTNVVEPPPERHHEKILTVEQFGEFIRQRENGSGGGMTFVKPGECAYVYDFHDRRDVSRLQLRLTPAAEWLVATAVSGTELAQKIMLRLLNVTLADTLDRDSNLILLLRDLTWDDSGSLTSNVKRESESVSRSIVQKLRSESAIPEFFNVTTPIYREYPLKVTVQVYIEPVPATRSFFVQPVPVSVNRAIDDTLEAIVKSLIGEGLPEAYLGSPKF
jgi:hypothetical protein